MGDWCYVSKIVFGFYGGGVAGVIPISSDAENSGSSKYKIWDCEVENAPVPVFSPFENSAVVFVPKY